MAALRAPHRGGKLRLDASSHFSTTLDIAQARIDSAIGGKLLEFIDLEEMNWTPNAGPGGFRTQRASGYIDEMLTWLETMMESVLVLLPQETKMKAYKSAFTYIANELLVSLRSSTMLSRAQMLNTFGSIRSQNNHLLSKDVDKVSLDGLRQLLKDVDTLAAEATRLTSTGQAPARTPANKTSTGKDGLSSIWLELRQTLAIVLNESTGVAEYCQPSTRLANYNQVKPNKVATLLEKVAKYHSTRGGPASEQDVAAKRLRERDQVLRHVRR